MTVICKDVKTAIQYQHPDLDIVRAALNQTEASGGAERMMRAEKFHGTLYGTPQKCRPGKSLIGRVKSGLAPASSDYS